jgi:hypothetical protein
MLKRFHSNGEPCLRKKRREEFTGFAFLDSLEGVIYKCTLSLCLAHHGERLELPRKLQTETRKWQAMEWPLGMGPGNNRSWTDDKQRIKNILDEIVAKVI